MADDLVFYTNPMSRGRIVRWMLEEVGVPYRTELLDFGTSMKALNYLSINPLGKVPAVKHGDTVVTEAAAICAYLADVFPEKGLAPPVGSQLRGSYYRWMFMGAGPLEAASMDRVMGVSVPADMKTRVGYGSLEDMADLLDRVVTGRKFLVGDRFSAADVYVGSNLGWGMMSGSIPKRESCAAYVDGLRSRPAAIRAAKIDDDLIAAAKKG